MLRKICFSWSPVVGLQASERRLGERNKHPPRVCVGGLVAHPYGDANRERNPMLHMVRSRQTASQSAEPELLIGSLM